jgi:hypothetical protein
MSGGVAVRANLLCVTWSAARGHVFLFDLEARQRVSAWSMPPGEGGFSDAAGVALDEHFHLYVADPHGGRVRHFSVFGRHLADFGEPAPARGDAGRDRPGMLDRPHAIAVDRDTVYVAGGDQPRRCAVQRFRRSGEVRPPLWSCGDVEQSFGAPRALWVDGAGILVADTLNGRLQRFRGDGTFVAALPCGPRDVLARPIAVARRPDGTILVIDVGDRSGLHLFTATGQRLPAPPALARHCEQAIALCGDERGRLYVLDRHGERVLRFSSGLEFDRTVVDLAEHVDDFEPGGGP